MTYVHMTLHYITLRVSAHTSDNGLTKKLWRWFAKLFDLLTCTATDSSLESSDDKMNETVMMLNRLYCDPITVQSCFSIVRHNAICTVGCGSSWMSTYCSTIVHHSVENKTILEFKVCKSVHHHTIPINQPTRCRN